MDLMQLGWKARCLLLTRRRIPKIPPRDENQVALAKLREEYSFFLSITNVDAEEGCAVSTQATARARNAALTVEAKFEPTDLRAGAIGPWLQPGGLDGTDPCAGFGSLSVDLYVRRLSDGKVAPFASTTLELEKPFNENFAHETSDAHIALTTEDRFCCPPWLTEQAAAMWPPLDVGYLSKSGRGYRKFLVFHHPLGPCFIVEASLEMEPPRRDEHDAGDEKLRSGKIRSVELTFLWESIVDSWVEHDPVTPVYVAHVLAGPCIQWV